MKTVPECAIVPSLAAPWAADRRAQSRPERNERDRREREEESAGLLNPPVVAPVRDDLLRRSVGGRGVASDDCLCDEQHDRDDATQRRQALQPTHPNLRGRRTIRPP
jgi:hypothetical protein